MLKYYEELLEISYRFLNIAGMDLLNMKIRHKVFTFVILSAVGCDLICAMLFNERNFANLVNFMMSLSLYFHVLNHIVTLFWKRPNLLEFVNEVERFWPVSHGNTDEIFQRDCLSILRIVQVPLKVSLFFCYITAVLGTAVLVMGGGETTVLRYFTTWLEPYHAVNLSIDLLLGMYDNSVSMGFDVLFVGLTLILWMQFRILNENLAAIQYSDDEGVPSSETSKNAIKSCVIHHKFLMRCAEQLDDIYGPMLLIHLWIEVLIMCFCLYVMSTSHQSTKEFLKFFLYIVDIGGEMFFFYFLPAQLLSSAANNISQSIYNSKWYMTADPLMKRSLLIVMMRNQRDVTITAGKLMPMNFETCTQLFKTVISFNAFLRNMST